MFDENLNQMDELIRVNQKINDFWIDVRGNQLDFKYSASTKMGLVEVQNLQLNLNKVVYFLYLQACLIKIIIFRFGINSDIMNHECLLF